MLIKKRGEISLARMFKHPRESVLYLTASGFSVHPSRFLIFDYFTYDGPRKHCHQVRICFYAYIFFEKNIAISPRDKTSYSASMRCLGTHFLLLLGFES